MANKAEFEISMLFPVTQYVYLIPRQTVVELSQTDECAEMNRWDYTVFYN